MPVTMIGRLNDYQSDHRRMRWSRTSSMIVDTACVAVSKCHSHLAISGTMLLSAGAIGCDVSPFHATDMDRTPKPKASNPVTEMSGHLVVVNGD